MYAVTIPQPGPASSMLWAAVPDPRPGPDEVLIAVAASAVNRADLLQRAGNYPPPPGAPAYPGLECSGVITAVGSAVTRWRVGDEVCALLSGGGYAQLVAAPAGQCLPVPRGVPLADAAALPEVACTVWSNVVDRGRLTAMDSLLVHGGGSGVGTFAIQLARARGARVLTTARAGKHEQLRQLGAEITIDYTSDDFVAATLAGTGGRGADVILDLMGASYLERNVAALAVGGRLVIIGLQGGRAGSLDLGALLAKRAAIHATTLRTRPPEEKAAIVAAVAEHVWPMLEQGLIRPVIHERVPMAQAARAHRIVESSAHVGKVLLVTG